MLVLAAGNRNLQTRDNQEIPNVQKKNPVNFDELGVYVARPVGVEPAASGLEVRCFVPIDIP